MLSIKFFCSKFTLIRYGVDKDSEFFFKGKGHIGLETTVKETQVYLKIKRNFQRGTTLAKLSRIMKIAAVIIGILKWIIY